MAVSRVGVDSPFSNQKFRAALTDVFAGIICSILSIAYCLSYAALIFTGPLEHVLSYGVAVTFLSAAVGGSIVALRSSLPFAVAGPDSSISVVLAAMVATVVHRLVAHGGTDLLAPTLIAMSLATALTGLLLVRTRVHPCGPRHSFRPLSGHRRLSRCHRLVDDHRRDAGGDAINARHSPISERSSTPRSPPSSPPG